MTREIEHKFLVRDDSWKDGATGTLCRQGYLSTEKKRVVRVRTLGESAFVTIKGLTKSLSRLEFEYEIPLPDAQRLLDELCARPLIEKTRYRIDHGGLSWEVDVFHGENEGLVVVEVEVPSEDTPLKKPPWVGEEVSSDPRYFNSNLVSNPYSRWPS